MKKLQTTNSKSQTKTKLKAENSKPSKGWRPEIETHWLMDGSSTLEILIAFAILILAITAVIMVGFGNQAIAVDTQTNNEALYKAQIGLESLRASSRLDFNLVNPIEETLDDIYTKSVKVQNIDLYTKIATSTVEWKTDPLRTQKVELATIITNQDQISDLVNGGGAGSGANTCNSNLTGDWKNPQMVNYGFGNSSYWGDLLPSASSTFTGPYSISDIDAKDGKLYIVAGRGPNASSSTFFVFDISQPALKPVYLGSIDNDIKLTLGLNAVRVAGNYAFLANAQTDFGWNGVKSACTGGEKCGQLEIINVAKLLENPSQPNIKTWFNIHAMATIETEAAGNSIFYKDGIVYLGLARAMAGYNEFNIIDVGGGGHGGSATNPVLLGSYPVSDGGVSAIYVRDGYAYLATSDNTLEMMVVDVHDLTNPHTPAIRGFDAPGSTGFGYGKSIYVVGNQLYFGRTATKISGANDVIPEFYVLDIANPANIPSAPLGSLPLPTVADSINSLLVRDYLGFFVTNLQFQVWNIASTTNIAQWTSPMALPGTGGGGGGTGMDCEADRMYIGSTASSSPSYGYISVITAGP